MLITGDFQTRRKDSEGIAVPEVYGPGSYAVQPGGEIHAEVNAGSGELVALVYIDGPVDFAIDE